MTTTEAIKYGKEMLAGVINAKLEHPDMAEGDNYEPFLNKAIAALQAQEHKEFVSSLKWAWLHRLKHRIKYQTKKMFAKRPKQVYINKTTLRP